MSRIFDSLREIVVRKSIIPGVRRSPVDKRLREPGTSADMNVNGSITPVSFRYTPDPGSIEILQYVTLLVIDPGTFGATQFGSLAGLTNGIILNVNTDGVGPLENTTIKNNTDFLQCFTGSVGTPGVGSMDGPFDTADWLAGTYSYEANPLVLDGDKGDFIEIIVRDNLLLLQSMRASMRSWRVV